MKSRRGIAVLSILLVAVWGTVVYQIVESLGDDSKPIVQSRLQTSEADGPGLDEYVSGRSEVRDPFYFTEQSERSSNVKQETVRTIRPEPAPFRLVGIVGDRNRRSALLDAPDGRVHVLAAGDTLAGLKILVVQELSVAYSYRGRRGEWMLEREAGGLKQR